jgi:hypothetical protein
MQKSLRLTWAFVLSSTLAVLVSGGLLMRSFLRNALVDCRGDLRTIPLAELGDRRARRGGVSDVVIHYDEAPPSTYKNVRAEWSRGEGAELCSDAPIPWQKAATAGVASPEGLRIQRDDVTGAYAVIAPAAGKTADLTAFRKTNARGRRFVLEQLEGHAVALLVFVVALAALAMAGWRLWRAWPYATRLWTWHSGHLRGDGHVEDDHQTMLGRLEIETATTEPQAGGGAVLVDPAAIAPSAGYREDRVLGPRDVRSGSHATWTAATKRRLREACMLAALATVATGVTAATVATRGASPPPGTGGTSTTSREPVGMMR